MVFPRQLAALSRDVTGQMSDPLVSVLMPARNAEQWVAQALESVLGQTWRNLEIIVVDDGSTDATADVVAGFAKHGVRLLRQEGAGQSAAANAAFAASTGDLIKFFDADDVLGSDAIERQVSRLEGRDDCVASMEWARFRRDPSEARFVPEPVWRDMNPADWLVAAWERAHPMMQCALWLIPRPVLLRAGLWDARLSLINDFEFIARVLVSAKKVRFTEGARLYYRSGVAGSLSGTRGRTAVESAFCSVDLGTRALLGLEDTPRTRRVSANILQSFIYETYPEYADLRDVAADRVRALGGATLTPDGPPMFHLVRRVVGWRMARRIERAAVARGLNRRALREALAGSR